MSRPSTDYAVRDSYVRRFDADGNNLCRVPTCSNCLTGRQKKWCSKECGMRAFATWDWKSARIRVWERDHGRCATCGLDTDGLRETIRNYKKMLQRSEWSPNCEKITALLHAIGVPRNRDLGDDWWEADHITPLAEGGALCAMENLRTMCIFGCHKEETRKLAGRLAKAKRRQKKMAFGYIPLKFQEENP